MSDYLWDDEEYGLPESPVLIQEDCLHCGEPYEIDSTGDSCLCASCFANSIYDAEDF